MSKYKLKKADINALKCIQEILESYMEFVDMMSKTKTETVKIVSCMYAKEKWQPLLVDIKKDIKEQDNESK